MRLKVGNRIIEEDGIVTIVYTVVRIEGRKAIAETEFEGKTYQAAYKRKFYSPDNIHPWVELKGLTDNCTRKLIR